MPAVKHTFLHLKLGYELDRELAYYNATLDKLISSADANVNLKFTQIHSNSLKFTQILSNST